MKNFWLDKKEEKKNLKFKGKFQEADPVNRSGRLYPKTVWQQLIDKYKK
jgi:hypothetical protein